MIAGMKEVIETINCVKKELDARGGLKTVIFAACGGSFSASYPARYLLNAESTTFHTAGYNSSEFVSATPKCVDRNALVICISTKATPETVEALNVAKKAGAITIGLTGYGDSLTAQSADYSIVYYHSDEWYEKPELMHQNSQGTALKIAFELLHQIQGYPYYDKAMDAFEKLPAIYHAAYKKVKQRAVKFAMTYKDDTVWNVMASGAAWESAYSDAFCFFQEMQAVHCVPVHTGEYFHGAFETTDKDLAILLLKSVGRTRPLDDRVERFLDQYAGHHYVIDASELGLDELDETVTEYFNGLLIHPVTKQFIAAMADIRMHPMSYRRYMWKFEY